ncbi:aspartyl protease family protein [Saccharobesus litoralis]|nr:aspartyl protease family protein [Saccharobesus litoralis]
MSFSVFANVEPSHYKLAEQSFNGEQGFIEVRAKVNDVAVNAILDTGAAAHVMSQGLVDKLNIQVSQSTKAKVKGVVHTASLPFVNGVSIELLGQSAQYNQVIVAPNLPFDLIIGLPFLVNKRVQINYPKQSISLLNPHSGILLQVANLRFKRKNNLLLINTQIKDVELNLVLDTGNSAGVLLNRDIAVQHNWVQQYRQKAGSIRGVFMQAVSTSVLTVPRARIGPIKLTNAIVEVPEQSHTLSNLNRGYHGDGLIGNTMLNNFILTIDYDNAIGHVFVP